MEKDIDVIIPVYKAHNCLYTCLASIAMQTIAPKIQVTLVNDACPEGDYADIISAFKGRLSIQEIIMPENRGPGDAREYGIQHTNNEYIFFVDADDILAGPKALFWIYNEFKEHDDAWLIMGQTAEEMVDGELLPLPMPNAIWIFGKGYRRSIIEKYNIHFKPGSRSNEDVGFNVMFALLSSTQESAVRAVDKLVYIWQYKEDSITRVDDCMYTYLDGPRGWVDNLIYAYTTVRDMDDDIEVQAPFLYNMVAGWCAESHVMYNNTYRWHPELCQMNWDLFKRLYNETVRPHVDDMLEEEWQAGLRSVSDQGMDEVKKYVPFKDYMQALHDGIDFLDLSKYEEPSES